MTLKPPRLLLTALLAIFAPAARADYATTFSGGPYQTDQTIVGVDVWDHRLATGDRRPDSARAVLVRWNDYQPALMLKSGNLKATIPPAKGPKVTIRFDLALTFPESKALRQFRIGFGGDTPVGEFFFDMGEEGGLGCRADGSGKGGVIVLKKSEVAVNRFYNCTATIDYAARSYEIHIEGAKRDGSSFTYRSGPLPFPGSFKGKQTDYIYIITGPAMTAYLANLSIRSE